ncbi:MAG TPA: class I SAM-dependent methyltransferase [Candidatus Cloacimonadota bacterium]|nr:class I SAM-dependent methyltransferase [Candidatus Cloacimonadota bacterium]
MSIFKNYSNYYDLLYADKDYQKEASYVDQLIQQNSPSAKTILNLGCGTGKRDIEFAHMGYEVMGIDLSKEMIDIANRENTNPSKLQFEQGDIRTVRLNRKFDVVVSLFHVMSYQTTNEDLWSAFETARCHLKEGGLFIFDCWYGPGVLTDPPVTRVKRMGNENIDVLRIAEPEMHYDRNTVDVNYEIRVKEKNTRIEEIIKEKHTVRYLFLPEINLFSEEFILINNYAWLTTRAPASDWYVISIYKNKQ